MTEQTKRRILVTLIILSVLPSALLPVAPTHFTLQTTTLYLSTITGYIGVMFLLWMYMLGARSVFGLLFHDLAPVMRIHKWLGKYGSVMILLHPLFVLISYGESLLYPLVPHISSAFERHVTLGRISFYLIVGIWIGSVLLRKQLGYRTWKYIHYLAYISLPFALLHIPGTGSQFASHTTLRVYYFGAVLLFFVFTLVRIRGWINVDTYTATVRDHQSAAENGYVLRVDMPAGAMVAQPGQYVYIKRGFISEAHPFSVVAANGSSLWLAYRAVGRYTEFLLDLAPGDHVEISRPYGEFLTPLASSSLPPVFIAGGIGITPFMQTLMDEKQTQKPWLFYANRSRASTLFAPALAHKLGSHCVEIYSDEPKPGPSEVSGFITPELIKQRLVSPGNYNYFICGPTAMMEHVASTLAALNVPKAQIHREAFEF